MYTKPQCRRQIMTALQNVDAKQSKHQAAAIYDELFAAGYWQGAQTIGVTLSTPLELDTQPIIEKAREQSKQIVIPKTLPSRQMAFVPFTPDTELEKTEFGILEPQNGGIIAKSAIDLMVVPGLGFTVDGQRLGFGGGYFDRYLTGYSGITVALALPEQLFKKPMWPVKEHDILINHVITVREET